MTAEQKRDLERSKEIEAENLRLAAMESEKIKLLLLGAGESGKSTIFKQMKILYGVGFNEGERRDMIPVIYSNTIHAMKQICDAAKAFGLDKEVKVGAAMQAIMETDEHTQIQDAVGSNIKQLWADEGIQKVWGRRSEFQVVETNSLYFNDIDEIMKFEYVPSKEHILACRVRTSGIIEEKYEIDGTIFEIIDVGGQRNERKKWIHCFDEVNAIIFVAAVSEYDQALFEDSTVNRMTEAIDLFNEMCNHKYFSSTAMILFLNKRDLFEDKIKRIDIKSVEHFQDYSGKPNDYDDGIEYFLNKFLAVNKTPTKDIYHHVTCATDSENVRVIFNATKDIILRSNLEGSGFM